jgi:hypothetical protein
MDDETREEAETFALTRVRGGFHDRDEVVEGLLDYLEDELSAAEAEELVGRLWRERVAEQATWPAETETDRVLAALESLEATGIVARFDFTCCNNCGVAEIGAEAGADARGYVFFHSQDTESAAAGHGLYLSYGTFGGPDPADIAGEVVKALTSVGAAVEWNGSVDKRILVRPLDWQLRLS